MKTITKISKLFILAMIVFAFNQNAKAWGPFTIPGTSWTIEFPSAPRPGAAVGPWTVYFHSAAGHPTFELRYHKLPAPGLTRPGAVNSALNTDINDYAREINGTVMRTVAAHNWKGGRSMIADIESPNRKMYVKVRAFIFNNQEKFMIVVHNLNVYPPVTEVDKFWNSLKQ